MDEYSEKFWLEKSVVNYNANIVFSKLQMSYIVYYLYYVQLSGISWEYVKFKLFHYSLNLYIVCKPNEDDQWSWEKFGSNTDSGLNSVYHHQFKWDEKDDPPRYLVKFPRKTWIIKIYIYIYSLHLHL